MQYALAVVKDKLSARYHGLDKTDFAESESTKLGTSGKADVLYFTLF
jgi:hypothetical protein